MIRGILMSLCALVLGASVAMAAPVTLKLGHIAEPDNVYGQGADHFAKLVIERSKGDINIQVYPSSQLGNQRDLVEGLGLGTVDMTLTGTAVMGNFVPEMAVFDLPFIFRDVNHAYKAKKGEKQGMITLAIWENGVRHMTNNAHPIKKPEDMKGLKFRVMEQPVYIEMMKSLGASPTPMAMSELYTALQKGVVDGQENPLGHIATKRFNEVQKYLSLTGHTYASEPLLISAQAWNRKSSARPPSTPATGNASFAAILKASSCSRSRTPAQPRSTTMLTRKPLQRLPKNPGIFMKSASATRTSRPSRLCNSPA